MVGESAPRSGASLLASLEARGLKLRGRASTDYKSADNLLTILRERKLAVGDEALARHYLATVGYHRFSTFYPAFYERDKVFDQIIPSSIDNVFHLYAFDRRLRLLLVGPLEKLEVALRALLIQELGDYLLVLGEDPATINLFDERFYSLTKDKDRINYNLARRACFDGASAHWAARLSTAKRLDDTVTRKEWSDAFKTYYKDVPAWVILQTASFGPLAHIYSTLKREIAVKIAQKFALPVPVLITAFFALKELRNACAHHEPVWNWDSREHTVELAFPKRYIGPAKITSENRNRLYAYCALIHILLGFLSHGNSTWFRRLKKLINEFSTLYGPSMGFPKDWQTMPFWCVSDVTRLEGYESLLRRVNEPARP